MSLSELVKQSAVFVAENSSHVSINEEALATFIDEKLSSLDELGAPMSVPLRFDNDDQLTNFWFLVDLLNFGSGWRMLLKEHTGHGAYDTILGGMLSWHLDQTLMTSSAMSNISVAVIGRMFRLPVKVEVPLKESPAITTFVDSPLMPLVNKLWSVIRKTGEILEDLGHKDFASFLKSNLEATQSAQSLLSLLVETFPAFRDVSEYKGQKVYIYKKAQLLVCDLNRQVESFKQMSDLDSLSVFTDNVLPCVLRQLNILTLKPELAAKIDSGKPLDSGDEEVELRMCAVRACDLIIERGTDVSPMKLDYYIWRLGKKPEFRGAHRHYTRDTIFY